LKGNGIGSTVFEDAMKFHDIKNPGYKGIRGRWEANNPDYVDGKVKQEYLPERLKGRRFLEDRDLGEQVDPDLLEERNGILDD